jgi:hypothetical protein
LKSRYWWFIISVGLFLAAAASIDQNAIPNRKILQANGTPDSTSQELITLQACGSIQTDFSGPLVPNLDPTTSHSQLGDLTSDEGVPKSAWSTRVGFSISSPTDAEYWAQMLGSGWYIDWNIRTTPSLPGLDHWQMIRVHENCISPSIEEIQSAVARFPGQVWIIGNEPDVIWQDNITAVRYAAIYHDLYTLIKSSDPTSLIAVGGVSQATPLRLNYLDQVLQTYQSLYNGLMPVDWWTVHGYVLREEKGSWGVDIPPGIEATQGELREVKDHGRLDLFEAQLRSFRQWMADHGYQHTPLALTEFGILMPAPYGFPADVVGSYLEQTFTWLTQTQDGTIGYPEDGNHLVQKWAWFSVSDPTYASSDLGDLSSGKLTAVGESFRNMVATMLP